MPYEHDLEPELAGGLDNSEYEGRDGDQPEVLGNQQMRENLRADHADPTDAQAHEHHPASAGRDPMRQSRLLASHGVHKAPQPTNNLYAIGGCCGRSDLPHFARASSRGWQV